MARPDYSLSIFDSKIKRRRAFDGVSAWGLISNQQKNEKLKRKAGFNFIIDSIYNEMINNVLKFIVYE